MIKQFNRATGHEWVIHIKRTLEEGIDDEDVGIPVCIFCVPKSLVSTNQEAYIPQLVAIGPYHRRRVELFESERSKLIFAEKIHRKFDDVNFSDIVGHIDENMGSIRACYHAFLDFDRDELAWTLVIDASFLLACLQAYLFKNEESSMASDFRLAQMVDLTKKKHVHQVIRRDILMLENQIPLFILREVNRFIECENSDEMLALILMRFCKHLSPIKIRDGKRQLSEEFCLEKYHLLDLLYCVVAPKMEEEITEAEEFNKGEEKHEDNSGLFQKAWKSFLSIFFFILIAPIWFLIRILKSKALKKALSLPWQVIKKLFHLDTKIQLTHIVSTAENVAAELESVAGSKDASLLIEQFSIPSAQKLSSIGVKFIPTMGGLKTIRFDKSSNAFYLPVVDLDDISEVVLRNLVAYEACLAPECTVFTRYVEFMSCILYTKEDVKILRDSGVVLNRLKSDEEAASLWHGMTRFVKITKVPILDKAIEDANACYSKNWKVRMGRFFKKKVKNSWPILTFLAANILILLSALQAICSVYDCKKWIGNHAADKLLL